MNKTAMCDALLNVKTETSANPQGSKDKCQKFMTGGNHTPGPWHHGKMFETTHDGVDRAFFGIGTEVAPTHIGYASVTGLVNQAEAEANARLIVAAPELLEACKALLEWTGKHVESHRFHELGQVENAARNAIAKAEGSL